jgi:hypothetical protein
MILNIASGEHARSTFTSHHLHPTSMSPDLFNQIADELVLEIMKYIFKDHVDLKTALNHDLWMVSLCSHRLRRIIFPLLYHTIYIDDSELLKRFLHVVIDSLNRANLVKSLVLDCNVWEPCPSGVASSPVRTELVEIAQSLSPPLDFIGHVEGQAPWANVLLLGHLLQSLEVLSINTGSYENVQWEAYLSDFLNLRFFSAKLRLYERDAQSTLDYVTLIPAFLIPSMTKICANGVDSGHWFHWFYQALDIPRGVELVPFYRTSNVERLELCYVSLPGNELEELLQLPHSLKSLVCKHGGTTTQGQGHPLIELRNALEHVARDVEFLYVDWYDPINFTGGATVWSFRNFLSLKALRITYQLIYNTDLETASCITETLPPSIEELALHPHYSNTYRASHFVKLWRNILVKKSRTVLPNLCLIAHFPKFTILDPLLELANSRNVKIALKWEDLRP